MFPALKSQFLLDPDIVFLNHGSFGACPRPVFEDYQRWQWQLERQPVEFLGRRAAALLAGARQSLADYVGARAQDVIFFPNPTTAMNMIARNLSLQPGDEVLTTDHEYGAIERALKFVSRSQGFAITRQTVPLPLTSKDDFVEAFWRGVSERTRAIVISHLTSATALRFPIEAICHRARQAGILTVVDGAHAPGQIDLNLTALDPDVYVGALHKWVCAPKGAAFAYVRRDLQDRIDPLVVSWGWGDEEFVSMPDMGETQFIRFHEWQGTRDLAAYLATPAAIAFQRDNHWHEVRAACHALALEARQRLHTLWGLPGLCPPAPDFLGQFFAARLPACDTVTLKKALYDDYRIEVPVYEWNGAPLIRVSIQAYNTPDDVQALLRALGRLLP